MKVVVLGAGASFGASEHGGVPCPVVDRVLAAASQAGIFSDPVPDRVMSELDKELREAGTSLEEFRSKVHLPEYEGHLAAFKGLVSEQLGVAPNLYETVPVDFELLFGLLESALLGFHGLMKELGRRPEGPVAVNVMEQQFHLVLCGTLMAATRDIHCAYHRRLANWLAPGDVVISFNYDLLIDRALRETGRWLPEDGYRLSFHKIGSRKGKDMEWRDPSDSRSDVSLLKLHGSLNWLYPRTPWETLYKLNMYGADLPVARDALYCLEDLNPAFEDDFPVYEWWARYEHDDAQGSYDLHSLIVPPSISKPYHNFEHAIGPLWAKALRALLDQTTDIYLIGYSLRRDDLRAWWLFRKAAAESAHLRNVFVVNPSDEVLRTTERAFQGRRVERLSNTLGEFAKGI